MVVEFYSTSGLLVTYHTLILNVFHLCAISCQFVSRQDRHGDLSIFPLDPFSLALLRENLGLTKTLVRYARSTRGCKTFCVLSELVWQKRKVRC